MKTDAQLAEKFGFATEEDFLGWIKDQHEEQEIQELKVHRFLYFAGVNKLDHPCHCECLSGDHNKCEHSWDGEVVEDSFGGVGVTCSNCRMPFISHLLRTGP